MPALHIDARFGMGGDMFLAGLAGLGLDLQPLEQAFACVGIPVRLQAPVVRVHGLAGHQLHIETSAEQPLRHLPDILSLLAELSLSDSVRSRSAAAFTRLAEAEAAVHGVPVESIHFHEVGAVDTLIDIVGALYGIEVSGIEDITCSTLPWFTGQVQCAHGTLSLPAPATLEFLKGKPVHPTHYEQEIITPTGALVLDTVVTSFGSQPEGTIIQTATSFGQHDLGSQGAGLRLILFERPA